jgi:hypothetical protein
MGGGEKRKLLLRQLNMRKSARPELVEGWAFMVRQAHHERIFVLSGI